MIDRRQLDRRRHADLSQFCQPPRDEDLPLRLAEGLAESLLAAHPCPAASTADLIEQAKLKCPPLRGSINSRAFAIAVLVSCTLLSFEEVAERAQAIKDQLKEIK